MSAAAAPAWPAWVMVSLDIVRAHLDAYRQATGRVASLALVEAFQADQLKKLHAHLDDPEHVGYRDMTLAEWEREHPRKGGWDA